MGVDHKDKFAGKVANIDKEMLWNSIKDHKDFPKKKTNWKVIYWTIGVLLALGTIVLFDISSRNQQVQSLNENLIEKNSIIHNVDAIKEAVFSSNEGANYNIGAQEKIINEEVNIEQELALIKNKSKKYVDLAEGTVIDKKIEPIHSSKKKTLNEDDSVNLVNKEIEQPISNKKGGYKNNEAGEIEWLDISKQNIQRGEDDIKDELNSSYKENNLGIANSEFVIEQLPLLTNDGVDIILSEFHLSKNEITLLTPIRRFNWMININYALVNAFFDFEQKKDVSKDYNYHYNNPHWVESHLFKIGLKRKLYDNWLIGVGLSYHNLHQKFVHTKETKTYIRNEDSPVSAPFYTAIIKYSDAVIYHHHTLIDFDINIEKLIPLRYVDLKLRIGTGFNLLYNVEGNHLAPNFDIEKINKTHYKSYLSPVIKFGIGISKNLTRRISVEFGVDYNSSRSTTISDAPYIQSYYLLQSSIGLSYKF